MQCKFCEQPCQKTGRQKNGRQRYYCKGCKKYQQDSYQYVAYKPGVLKMIPAMMCEGSGIRSIARVLRIGVGTVLRNIQRVARAILKPAIPVSRESFELDKVRTFVCKKDNPYWIAYALCSQTKQVIDLVVGRITKRTLRMIVNTLLLSGVKTIKTDRLNIYQSLIPASRHISAAYNINHIERNNLNLRTHLKRLGRRTICFSKSLAMLEACLKIYFWYIHPAGV